MVQYSRMNNRAKKTLVRLGVACLFVIFPLMRSEADGLHEEAVRYRDEGYRLQRSGDLKGALQAYQKSAAIDTSDPVLDYYFGLYYQQAGDLKAAQDAFAQALVLNPNYPEALWSVARLHQQLGNKEQALYHWLKLGMIYEQHGDHQRAQQAYQQVLELDPNYLEANNHLALVEERLGHAGDASLHWMKTGLLEEQRGEFEAARQAYQRVVVLNPTAVEAQSNLALLEERLGHREAALQQWLRLAQLYDQQGQLDAAKRTYERILNMNPDSVDALSNLAILHERSGNRDQAILYWSKCQQLAGPDDPRTQRAAERLMALGALKTGPAYHKHVVQQELEAQHQSLDEFRAATDSQPQR